MWKKNQQHTVDAEHNKSSSPGSVQLACVQLERDIANRRIAYLVYPSPTVATENNIVDFSAGVFYRRQRLLDENIHIGKSQWETLS